MTYKRCADRWDRHHVHRASLDAGGRTRQDALIWDDVIVMFDKTNDPKFQGTNAERTPVEWRKDRQHRQDTERARKTTYKPRIPSCRAADTGKRKPRQGNPEPTMPESWKSETQLRNHGRHRSLDETSCCFPTNILNMNRSSGNPLPPQAHGQGNIGVGANWEARKSMIFCAMIQSSQFSCSLHGVF